MVSKKASSKKRTSRKKRATKSTISPIYAVAIAFVLLVGAYAVPQFWPPLLMLSDASQYNDVLVRAKGDTGTEKLEIRVGGKTLKKFTVGKSYQNFIYKPNGVQDVGNLEVHYVNDGKDSSGKARNVTVDYIKVNGKTYQTEHSSTLSKGSWNKATQCAQGKKKSEKIHCNGWMRYNVPSGTKIGGLVIPSSSTPLVTPVASDSPSFTNLSQGQNIETGYSVKFASNGTKVADWSVHVGSAKNAKDYGEAGRLPASQDSYTLQNLPKGKDVFVTLYYKNPTTRKWIVAQSVQVSVKKDVISVPSSLINLTPGQEITNGQKVTFSTNDVNTVSWAAHVGSTEGGKEHFESGTLSTSDSYTLNNLPAGTDVFVTPWYKTKDGKWRKSNPVKVYSRAVKLPPEKGTPTITNLTDGQQITSNQKITFSAAGKTLRNWIIRVGSKPEGNDLYDSGKLTPTTTSHTLTVKKPPSGKSVYLTLYYLEPNRQWQGVDYTFLLGDISDDNEPSEPSGSSGPTDRTSPSRSGGGSGVTLKDSGAVSVLKDNTLLQDLRISSPHGKCGIRIVGRKNITIKNIDLSHAGIGICVIDSQNVVIQNVRVVHKITQAGPHCKPGVSVRDCKYSSRGSASSSKNFYPVNSNLNIYVSDSRNVAVDKAYLEKGEAGIWAYKSPGTTVNNLHCKDMRGPYWRGQCAMFSQSDNSRLTNFYVQQFLATSSGHDNISSFDSTGVVVDNGRIDGNFSQNGVGVIADSNAHNMTVKNVDMKDVAIGLNAWSGDSKTNNGKVPQNFTAQNIRVKDVRCMGTWRGPDVRPSSGGVAFAIHPNSQNGKWYNLKYWNHNCSSWPFAKGRAVVEQVGRENFTMKKPPVDMAFPWSY